MPPRVSCKQCGLIQWYSQNGCCMECKAPFSILMFGDTFLNPKIVRP